jgi:hypothetical protein
LDEILEWMIGIVVLFELETIAQKTILNEKD